MADPDKETLDGKIEGILEEVKEEVEEIVQEQQGRGELRKVPGYDPDFTRNVLDLDLPLPRVLTARTIARGHGRQDEFDRLYILHAQRGGSTKVPDLARIVDEAVGAREPGKPLTFWQQAKAWYYRQGPRLQYNTEMIFGSILEYPAGTIGGLIGGAVFAGMQTPEGVQSTLDSIAGQYIWCLSDWASSFHFSSGMVTLMSLLTAGVAYWSGALYLRSRDQESVYEKYPEIRRRDTWRFLSAGLLVGVMGSVIRGYVTYRMNDLGFGSALAALGGMVPSQAFAFTAMNIYGTYAGLVRDEEKLAKTILEIKEKRGELPQLEPKVEEKKDVLPG